MKTKTYMTSLAAKRWLGQPVCLVLKDGRCCVGRITGVHDNHVKLSGIKFKGKRKAKVSGYIPGMFDGNFGPGNWDFNPLQLYGGIPAGTFPSTPQVPQPGGEPVNFVDGFSNMMGTVKKVWPDIKFGIGVVQQIVPFMKGLGLKL